MTINFVTQSRTDPLHVAIVLDGNGRWAAARGLPRAAGHGRGAQVVAPIVRAAGDLGIGTLTLYALSSDNFARPAAEIEGILDLLRIYLSHQVDSAEREGVRISVLGRRDRFGAPLLEAIEAAESRTLSARGLHLRLAIDYSSRDAIVRAARHFHVQLARADGRASFARLLSLASHGGGEACDVDLLIRTGGEQRLSDFLLWECAYAELVFVPEPWPEFEPAALKRALDEFRQRRRRFGGLPTTEVG